ncbi:MAG TPA: hypothetical protein PLD90_09095 [Rhodocyclaceae bacterium]|uniref:hypothetical protein n=1 Tax=Zoogloea sp. TaxID=49181 RepID=UPI002B967D6A|nr:hypothetical protein [Zoogloea sp.]HMW53484.1 hypothetical protein [Rhodocyclaceae bacterium]HMY49782.1 hypothetical protein [Rhodocyclaceae bacterium]HNA66856.1 hypothetical protein [Rhodocyclaceae bacterium]HNC80287.1 hypothetical protein [Rhodocyclaceae bacterium]HNE17102.1 hypothetical protein [Rhodocyclaceae bacterium]
MSEVRLEELLAPGVVADDVPELDTLLRARPLLAAFSTLFHGSEAEVLARLLVLREIGRDAQTTHWTPERLRQRFTYLDPVKLETVLRRLRGNGLLDIGDDNRYTLSDLGRNAVAAVDMLVGFSAGDDLELGFLTAQLAGLQAVGSVTPEALGHLLGKLNDLAWHFEDAIASGSEFRIADARRRLSANTRWIEKGTEVLRTLLADPELPFDLARLAQPIGLAQSRLARIDAAFQRAVNKIEAQRVTLGGSGISSSDVAAWLRGRDARALAALARNALAAAPDLTLLAGGHELLDRAELALSEDARRMEADTALPPPEEAPRRDAPEQEDLRLLEHFSRRLARLAEPGQAPETLARAVAGGGFPAASYRLSLLALLADGGDSDTASPADGPIGDFMRLPVDIRFELATEPVNEDEIATMSAGLVGARGRLPAAEAVPVLDPDTLPGPA